MSAYQMPRLWEIYPGLIASVKCDHTEQKAEHGHNFYHAFQVAQYAQLIAPEPLAGRLGWIAGLCHNTDHIFNVDDSRVERIVRQHLKYRTDLNIAEKNLVVEAVLKHHKPNDDTDGPVTIILKDADRLANLDATHFIRAGQFRSSIPVFDPRYIEEQDPAANFKDPKTHIRNLQHTLEWETWFRLPKAKEFGKKKCDFVRAYLARIQEELREVGLYPCPPELLVEM